MAVPIEKFGKDHWSTFAYLETCLMDGVPVVPARMRKKKRGYYPTRLAGGAELADHDDYDCLSDCASAGLLELKDGKWALTQHGVRALSDLRAHKRNGGSFSTFTWAPPARRRVKVVHDDNVLAVAQGTTFLNCAQCLQELPKGVSPAGYAQQQVSLTTAGIQVWCNRHDCNIDHMTLEVSE